MKFLFPFFLTFWLGSLLPGQSVNFIDSLFNCEVNNLDQQKNEWQLAEIKRLKNDLGLSISTTITNTNFEQNGDDRLSTRLTLSTKLWRGGYKQNLLDADIQQKEMLINELEGDEESIQHHYSIYYNYIQFLSNQEKIDYCDRIIGKANEFLSILNDLYHQKLVDYDLILSVRQLELEYLSLQQTLLAFNQVFEPIAAAYQLPTNLPAGVQNIDFSALFLQVEKDTVDQQILALEESVIEDKYERFKLPGLSLSLGYDLSRKRSYYAIGFSVPLNGNIKNKKSLEQELLRNRYEINKVETQKELLNLSYEYQYKQKQYQKKQYEILAINEKRRLLDVKSDILSIDKSLEAYQLELNNTLKGYELLDLKGQSLLKLLQIKRKIYPVEIGDFVENKTPVFALNKYARERFLIVDTTYEPSNQENYLLAQNEISPIRIDELEGLGDFLLIDPNDFENRPEMEGHIAKTAVNSKIVITDFEAFKAMELRTIREKNIQSELLK